MSLEFYPRVFVESHFETVSTPSSAGSDPRGALRVGEGTGRASGKPGRARPQETRSPELRTINSDWNILPETEKRHTCGHWGIGMSAGEGGWG